jgi:hypothetical protein
VIKKNRPIGRASKNQPIGAVFFLDGGSQERPQKYEKSAILSSNSNFYVDNEKRYENSDGCAGSSTQKQA